MPIYVVTFLGAIHNIVICEGIREYEHDGVSDDCDGYRT